MYHEHKKDTDSPTNRTPDEGNPADFVLSSINKRQY